MAMRSGDRAPLTRALREPTVSFLLAAALLFLLSWLFGSGGEPSIVIDPEDMAWRIEQVEVARGATLSPELRREVEQAYIDEQVLVREALAMGLDDDPRIHDILAQKMLHVLSGDVIQPTSEELRGYYRENLARYTPGTTLSVDEIVVRPDVPNPAALPAPLRAGGEPEDLLGEEVVTHRVMDALTTGDVAALFDEALAESAFAAQPGDWVGPHESVRGRHWLRVNERIEPDPLPFEGVREQVRLDWIGEREQVMLDARVEELRGEYVIEIMGRGVR